MIFLANSNQMLCQKHAEFAVRVGAAVRHIGNKENPWKTEECPICETRLRGPGPKATVHTTVWGLGLLEDVEVIVRLLTDGTWECAANQPSDRMDKLCIRAFNFTQLKQTLLDEGYWLPLNMEERK